MTLTGSATVEHVFVGVGEKLIVNGNLLIQNSVGDALLVEGLVKVHGSISIVAPEGRGLVVMDSIYNEGTIYIQDVTTFPGFGMEVRGGGGFKNDGLLFVTNCSFGLYTDVGFVWNSHLGEINSNGGGVSITNSSTFSINEGRIETTAAAVSVIEGGKLENRASGIISTNGAGMSIKRNGILDSYGTVNIDADFGVGVSYSGNLNLKSGSIFNIGQGANDRLSVYEGGKVDIELGAFFSSE